MKKLIIACLLSLNCGLYARTTVPDSTTQTPKDDSTHQILDNYMWGVDLTDADNPVLRRLVTDASGNLKVSPSGSFTFINSGGVSVTNPATAAVQVAGSVTNTVNTLGAFALNTLSGTAATAFDKLTTGARTWGWVSLSTTALSGITTNATTTLSVTHVAGTSAYSSYWVKVGDVQGVTVMRVIGHDGVTVPTSFAAANGPQYFPSDNSKTIAVFDKTGATAPQVSFRAAALSGATSGTVWLEVWGQP